MDVRQIPQRRRLPAGLLPGIDEFRSIAESRLPPRSLAVVQFTRLALWLVVGLFSSACTIRYSQSLTARLPPPSGSEVKASAQGFALLQLVISEPKPAHELVAGLMGQCQELNHVQVDYRELSFLLFSLPKVTVTANCVK